MIQTKKNWRKYTFLGIYEENQIYKKNHKRGQCINSKGNIVIIGDINSGEVSAGGNIIVLGSIRGHVRAGVGGNRNNNSCFYITARVLQIADLIVAPDDGIKPSYLK